MHARRRYSCINGRAHCLAVPGSGPDTIPRRNHMAKNLILWMLGVPISILILLNIFGFL